jgi:hypothetical protein
VLCFDEGVAALGLIVNTNFKRLMRRYCQLIERMEELVKKKDEGKKRSGRRGVDNAVLCRRFYFGDLIPGLEAGL